MYSYYEGIGQLNSTEHQQAVQEARNQAEGQKQIAQQQVADMLSQWLGYYEDKYNLDDLFHQKTDAYNTSLAQEWSMHLARLDEIGQRSFRNEHERQQAIDAENSDFASRLSNTYQELTAGMDQEEKDALETYMRWALDTAVWGGETSTEAQRMVQTIMTAMDKLPEETQTSMQEVFNGAGQIVKDRAPGFIESCIGTFTGWKDDILSAWGINSPSKVMKQIFGYIMDGAQIGFEDGADVLLNEATDFANDFTDAMTPQSPSLQNAAALSRLQEIQNRNQSQPASQQTQFSITVHIDRFENRTDQDINALAQRIMTESETIYRRRAVAYGTGY